MLPSASDIPVNTALSPAPSTKITNLEKNTSGLKRAEINLT